MSAAWLIATKDLRQRARDRSLFIVAFIAPLTLSFVFSVVFGGLDDGGERIDFGFGVVDLDDGDQAAGFIELLGELESSGLLTITAYDDVDTAREAVDDGDVDATIVLPAGLSTALSTGTSVEIGVIGSVDAPIATSVATSISRSYATRSGTAALAGVTSAATGAVDTDQIEAVAQEVAAAVPLAAVAPITTDTPRPDVTSQMVAGLSVFFVFFVAGTAITGVLEERAAGTLPRLLISPIPRGTILVGKATAAIVAGVVALVALMIASALIMGADWGNPVGALILATSAVLAATGIMSMVGGSAKTPEQAGNLQAIVAVSMAMLGGSFGLVAPSTDSVWGQLALFTPNRWFMDGIAALGAGEISDVLLAVGALLVMAAVTGAVAVARADRVLRP